MTNNLMAALAEHIEKQPNYKPAQGAFVSIYRSSRHYGGPEEGGWWYTITTLEGSTPFPTRELAEAFLAQATAHVEQMNRDEAPARARAFAGLPDEDLEPCPADAGEGYIPNGWSDGGELDICVEDKQGERDNSHEPTPHTTNKYR